METGKHKNVKIIGAFLGQSKEKKTPYYALEFQNEQGETIEHAFYLTEKTQENNIKLLAELGYKAKSLTDMANPKMKISDLFGEPIAPIELVIESEEYTAEDGEIKTKQIVKWVNVGQRGGLNKIDHATAIQIFKSTTFDGLLMQQKKSLPVNDDIPF